MTTIESIIGDITTLGTDAIVNAAKVTLDGGSGVDGAIHDAAGPELKVASMKLAPCPAGEARVTPGFRLPAKWVVHTVGPQWQEGGQGEAVALANCYRNSLREAMRVGAKTIAFPGIGTSIYRYPFEEATEIAVAAIREFVREHPDAFDRISLVWLEADRHQFAQGLLE